MLKITKVKKNGKNVYMEFKEDGQTVGFVVDLDQARELKRRGGCSNKGVKISYKTGDGIVHDLPENLDPEPKFVNMNPKSKFMYREMLP